MLLPRLADPLVGTNECWDSPFYINNYNDNSNNDDDEDNNDNHNTVAERERERYMKLSYVEGIKV